MKYIKFTNKGEIDAKAFQLIGASTKTDDDTKIGMFGSGLNYSIAWLIRNEVDFKVYSGKNEIKFETVETEFREQLFKTIIIDGVRTSLTTTMGKDWKPWFVLREVYCNALDEEDSNMEEVDELFPAEGETHFYIECTKEIQNIINDWDLYFSNARTDMIAEIGGVKIYPGGNNLVVYRKGIRCHFGREQRCLFNYDMSTISINESREVSSMWDMNWSIVKFLKSNANDKIVKKILRDISGTYEEDLDWESFASEYSDTWKESIGEKAVVESEFAGNYSDLLRLNDSIQLPAKMTKELLNRFDTVEHIGGELGKEGITDVKPDEKQAYLLKKAVEFLKECDYDIKHDIKVAEFKRAGILGQASNETIYIGVGAFESTHKVVQVIIEENEHLVSGCSDETRGFQDHLIKMFIDEKVKRFSYAL